MARCPYAGGEECEHCMYFGDPCFDWLFDDEEVEDTGTDEDEARE